MLQLLAEGLANKVIAHRLGSATTPTSFHVTRSGKLDAEKPHRRVVKAARLGLIAI